MWGADTQGLEVFAAIALGFLWIHTLLIAYAALLDRRGLASRLARAREAVVGTVVEAAGPEGVLARAEVDQVGRTKGDGVVHFADRAHRSVGWAGVLEVGGERHSLELEGAEVWPELDARERAAAPESAAQLESVLPQAKRAKGWRRTVAVDVGAVGSTVYYLPARGQEPAIVSAIDPLGWLRSKRRVALLFVFAELAVAAGCTVLALVPPAFGWVSMLGGAACLGFFLGVQPLGVALTDALRTPDRAYLRGRWG